MEIANRESFLIDPDGVVVKHYQRVNPENHTQEVIADLERLRQNDHAG
jgi:peroxiredoxin Q/BCP